MDKIVRPDMKKGSNAAFFHVFYPGA